ncbi:MAG: hypothetical protein JXR48_13445 [Candidatus Delongbacteria bacterium]|nr:hypothetical protein [Candidatus Delongbacteria bacterium]MBN2835960.1 hypothetical protein [Candidatus Delongbacteria bacterium]
MKILAIEKEICQVDWSENEIVLIDEAKEVYKLLLEGNLREIYFSETKSAVLILECDCKDSAKRLLNRLPLVERRIIDFDLIELHPYTGIQRLVEF